MARVSYATSLMKKGVLISTTEHLLSALLGSGVDNAIIEIDSLELPILDGSGMPFVEMIQRAGLRRQRARRSYLRVLRAAEVRVDGKRIGIYPADSYRLTCTIDFPHPLIGRQSFELELTPENYVRNIAPARTFGFLRDVDALRDMGLIRGASLDSALVLTDAGLLNSGGLRFADEFWSPQVAGPDRRSGAHRPAAARARHCGTRRPPDARGSGGSVDARPFALGRSGNRGFAAPLAATAGAGATLPSHL